MREEFRKAVIEGIKENGKTLQDQSAQVLAIEYKGLFDFAAAAIRGAFILNGSAAVAILYNFRHLFASDATSGLLYVAIGASLAVLCSGIICLAQRVYFSADNLHFRKSVDYYDKLIMHFETQRISLNENKIPLRPPYTGSKGGFRTFYYCSRCMVRLFWAICIRRMELPL